MVSNGNLHPYNPAACACAAAFPDAGLAPEPLVVASVTVSVGFPGVVVDGAVGNLTVDCGGGTTSISAAAESLRFEGVVVTDVLLSGTLVRRSAPPPVKDNMLSSMIDPDAAADDADNDFALVEAESDDGGGSGGGGAEEEETYLLGYATGTVSLGDASSSAAVTAFYMFDTRAAGYFRAGVKLTLDKPPLYVELEVRGGVQADFKF